jgi:hypothetical protein
MKLLHSNGELLLGDATDKKSDAQRMIVLYLSCVVFAGSSEFRRTSKQRQSTLTWPAQHWLCRDLTQVENQLVLQVSGMHMGACYFQ